MNSKLVYAATLVLSLVGTLVIASEGPATFEPAVWQRSTPRSVVVDGIAPGSAAGFSSAGQATTAQRPAAPATGASSV